jgi:glycosyltransferase involved in cell wall biosynthesis
MSQTWEEAQEWELGQWLTTCNGCANTWDEERKQRVYCEHMGIAFDHRGQRDLRGKSVLDVGGGPASLLLRTINGGRLAVADPLAYPDWVLGRYEAAGIEYLRLPGEDLAESGWDEVWLYNCLQHVQDPEVVLRNCLSAGKVLRIFEWVDTGTAEGHLHNLTTKWFEGILGNGGREVTIHWGDNTINCAFAGVFGEEVVPIVHQPFVHADVLRFHVPALPHVRASQTECGYTNKTLKLCAMLRSLGHEVYYYGVEGAEVDCTENVPVVSEAERQAEHPTNDDPTKQLAYDTTGEYHQRFCRQATEEIEKRLGERDFLLCGWGWGHQPIAAALGSRVMAVESGIGYQDTFTKFRVFESYCWMHYVWGTEQGMRQYAPSGPGQAPMVDLARERGVNGSFYDAVIPNFFDPAEFRFQEDKEDWFLYHGRIAQRKGVELAVQLTERIGAKLVIAGQGTLTLDTGTTLRGDHIEFAGHADLETRRDLYARAKAIIMPTYYVEPFGGVAVEAMLSGTPVITTDFGAFAETVLHGVTGYRCHALEEFEWAARHVGDLSPYACRDWALQNYSMERVRWMYEHYFRMLEGLWGDGWPAPNPERTELDWLTKMYPEVR